MRIAVVARCRCPHRRKVSSRHILACEADLAGARADIAHHRPDVICIRRTKKMGASLSTRGRPRDECASCYRQAFTAIDKGCLCVLRSVWDGHTDVTPVARCRRQDKMLVRSPLRAGWFANALALRLGSLRGNHCGGRSLSLSFQLIKRERQARDSTRTLRRRTYSSPVHLRMPHMSTRTSHISS